MARGPALDDHWRWMATFVLSHRHEPAECAIAHAAWRGFDSPLRRHPALGSCAGGGHALWWTVDAASEGEALAQVPPFVAERTTVERVGSVSIP